MLRRQPHQRGILQSLNMYKPHLSAWLVDWHFPFLTALLFFSYLVIRNFIKVSFYQCGPLKTPVSMPKAFKNSSSLKIGLCYTGVDTLQDCMLLCRIHLYLVFFTLVLIIKSVCELIKWVFQPNIYFWPPCFCLYQNWIICNSWWSPQHEFAIFHS